MGTVTASGRSDLDSVDDAVRAAVGAACERLGGAVPVAGFLFASKGRDLQRAVIAARRASPTTTFIASSTGGELSEEGFTRGGVSVMLIASDEMRFDAQFSRGLKANDELAIGRLARDFEEASSAARKQGFPHSTTFLFFDGLSPLVERIVGGLRKYTRPFQQIVGGGAADDWELKRTVVGTGSEASDDAAVAMHLFTKKQIGVGVEHGLTPNTKRLVATRTSGNTVFEVDGQNAYQFYRAYAATCGVELTEQNRGAFMLQHPFGVYFFEDMVKARAPLAVTQEGAVICAGAVPEGASVCMVSSKADAMIAAATKAAIDARQALEGATPAGVLMFDCVCRQVVLEERFNEEIAAVRAVFPGVPLVGYLTYGEVARIKGRMDGYHNNTVVVAAIPA